MKKSEIEALRQELELWKHRALVAEAKAATIRSPKWHSVKVAHLKKEPACQFCGGIDHPEVHHVKPFHLDRTKELSDSNLITLCEAPGKMCHLKVGHAGNWKSYNPNVREDCAKAKSAVIV